MSRKAQKIATLRRLSESLDDKEIAPVVGFLKASQAERREKIAGEFDALIRAEIAAQVERLPREALLDVLRFSRRVLLRRVPCQAARRACRLKARGRAALHASRRRSFLSLYVRAWEWRLYRLGG